MKSLENFYDNYHKKNDNYAKVISDNNFTYFYITKWWQEGGTGRPKLKILDIGCGVGTLSLYLASKGNLVKGIDISPRAIEIANKAKEMTRITNVNFAVEELTMGKQEYDFILCSEVIEHIKDEKKFLRMIYSNLKRDGKLLLTTPSKENLLYKIGYYKKFDKEVGHLRRYTKKNLKKLLKNNDFEVISIKEVEGPLRNILYTSKLGFIIKFIRGPLVSVFHLFDKISVQLFGASDIQILAKKT